MGLRAGLGGGRRAPGTAPPSRKRFHCAVCDNIFVSYDLKHHYEAKTNWELLERPRSGAEKDRGQVDPHTHYMWTNNYTMNSLPSYIYHK